MTAQSIVLAASLHACPPQVVAALYVDVEPYQVLKLPRNIRMLSRNGAIEMNLSPAVTPETTGLITQVAARRNAAATIARGTRAGWDRRRGGARARPARAGAQSVI